MLSCIRIKRKMVVKGDGRRIRRSSNGQDSNVYNKKHGMKQVATSKLSCYFPFFWGSWLFPYLKIAAESALAACLKSTGKRHSSKVWCAASNAGSSYLIPTILFLLAVFGASAVNSRLPLRVSKKIDRSHSTWPILAPSEIWQLNLGSSVIHITLLQLY